MRQCVSPRNWQFRLDDISDSLNLIAEYTKDLDFSSWSQDRKTIDAVIRNLEIIGEAASHIPESIQSKYPEIPWIQMKGMRNILIHEYFGVDIDVLWQTVIDDLPRLKKQIETLYCEIKKLSTD
ncbi:MAG: DUF86 domain-containing protein [Proteobacteria bacterium]|nr:DUF86 domain-containing protein [Pseudomonadota bacterium]